MAYILPERLLALVRPAFEQFGSRLHFKRANLCRAKKIKKKRKHQKKGSPKKRKKGFPLAKLDIA